MMGKPPPVAEIVVFVAFCLLICVLAWLLGSMVENAGGIQCLLSKAWNASLKIEGCK